MVGTRHVNRRYYFAQIVWDLLAIIIVAFVILCAEQKASVCVPVSDSVN